MATFLDWLGGFIPIGESPDPFAPFRNPADYIAPTIHTDTGESVVPMFKRPQRFVTPVLPTVPLYDTSSASGIVPNIEEVNGLQIVPQNSKRTGLMISNAGYGTAFISTFTKVSRKDYPIPPLVDIFITPSSALNVAPTNAVYAAGETGADLRILEIVLAPVGSEFTA